LLSLFITQNTAVGLQFFSHQLAVFNGALGFIGRKEKRDLTYYYVVKSRFLTGKAGNLGRKWAISSNCLQEIARTITLLLLCSDV